MNFKKEVKKKERIKDFTDWQVDSDMMEIAGKDALFMHCLPAYRGLEISETIMESQWSVVWSEAENRLHSQKALIELLLK